MVCKKSFWVITAPTVLCVGLLLAQVLASQEQSVAPTGERSVAGFATGDYRGKKIFWVDSYNLDFEWSDAIAKSIHSVLKYTDVEFAVYHMDTKPCPDEACIQAAAEKARAAIEAFKPDVLIASDDNAQKHLVVPYFKNTDLPVVFCGVNWDASIYGYPCENVTGMVEVDLVNELVGLFKKYARGDRIAYLSGDNETEIKNIHYFNKLFFHGQMQAYRVKTFDEFKETFLRLQQEADMLFVRDYSSIAGWDPTEAENFLAANTRIPTGSNNAHMAPFVVFAMGKIAEEQGVYAGQTALKILSGAKPSEIPVVENKQVRLIVNLRMARAANIVLPVSVMKTAHVIGKDAFDQGEALTQPQPGVYSGKRVLWVDSYHQGYEWSDGIEKGVRTGLHDSGAELKIFHMDTKRNDSTEFGQKAGLAAKAVVDAFRPDVVVASDDNAQKYLVVPYLKNGGPPVVFCGVNWDASMYGYPTPNVTGMVEVDQVPEMLEYFRRYTKGERIGYLSGDVETERKIVKIYNDRFFNGQMKTYLVRTLDEFKQAFLQAQQQVDMLYIYNYAGIADWDPRAAEEFLARETRIPTGSHNPFMANFVLFTVAKMPEEQGKYAATAALKVLGGAKPESIPVVENHQVDLTVNLKMAKAAGIVLPLSILKNATVIGQNALE